VLGSHASADGSEDNNGGSQKSEDKSFVGSCFPFAVLLKEILVSESKGNHNHE